MRHLLVPAVFLMLATSAPAQVVRCVDAAGKVSYTDQTCPANSREAKQVLGVEATPPSRPAGEDGRAEAARRVGPVDAPAPAGPSVAEQRALELAAAQQREIDRLRALDRQREAERQAEFERLRREADDARMSYGSDPYAVAPGFGPAARQRDMRPRIQGCDASGCHDRQGNTYNRQTGQLDRYQSLDGKTCRPVGTTVICR